MRIPLFVVVAVGALVPIGIALADIAGQAEARLNPAADGEQLRLVSLGERVVHDIRGTRAQTSTAIRDAREDGDVLLATCLEETLVELKSLERKAGEQIGLLRGAATAETARVSYVLLTVVGQKAELVAADAAQCRGAEWHGEAADRLAPPTDPNAVPSDDLARPTEGPNATFVPPPPAGPMTGSSPITEIPVEMPPVPPAATPTR